MRSIDIKYDSDLHTTLRDAITQRRSFSARKMSDYKSQWDEADDSLKAYIPTKEVDAMRKNKKRYEGKVDYVTLEVPYVYAQVMTMHTYVASVFLSRAPVWQYSARHGETQDAIDAVEAVMDYQLKVGNQLPVLYNWLYDMTRYSLGVLGIYWEDEKISVSKLEERPKTLLGIPLPGTLEKVLVQEEVRGYAGNKLYNIRPHDFWPDPRVPINRFQDGEFVGRDTSEGFASILSREQGYPGCYVNIKELTRRMKAKATGDYPDDGSPRVDLPFGPAEQTTFDKGTGFVKLSECYIKLIPRLWKLSDSSRMEIWCFTLADDEIIISARPLGFYHNKFPFSIVEGNFGADSFAKAGLVELIRPMTDIMTWLVNSHFYNVRKALNTERVVDPSRIVMKDLEDPLRGVIRLKPTAYGTDPRVAVHQLTTNDMTRTHIGDVVFVEQLLQRASGVTESIMGLQTSGRKTATEIRTSTSYSTSRLKIPAEYNSSLGFAPLAQMMLSNTQQLMDFERKYALAGNTLESAGRFLNVTPDSIAGFYDYVPVDGTVPIDRLAQATFWKELLIQLSRVPALAAQWDLGGLLSHVMKMQGERNIDRFRLQVGSPQALAQQAAAGNVVPIGGSPGGRGKGTQSVTAGTSGGTV